MRREGYGLGWNDGNVKGFKEEFSKEFWEYGEEGVERGRRIWRRGEREKI